MLNCEEIKQLLPKFDDESKTEECDVDALFNLDITDTHKDFEQQRVIQVIKLLKCYKQRTVNARLVAFF